MNLRKKKILLVDDEPDLVAELKLRLESSGWEVLTAYGGKEGLEKIRKEKPDLVLLDVMMPELDGNHVCRELKKDPWTKSIPTILLTAKAQEKDQNLGKECGADDYIVKPCDLHQLFDKIKKYVGEVQ